MTYTGGIRTGKEFANAPLNNVHARVHVFFHINFLAVPLDGELQQVEHTQERRPLDSNAELQRLNGVHEPVLVLL